MGTSKIYSVPKAIECFLDAMNQGDDYARFNYAILVYNGLVQDLPRSKADSIIKPLIDRGIVPPNVFEKESENTKKNTEVKVTETKIVVTTQIKNVAEPKTEDIISPNLFKKGRYEYHLGMDKIERFAFGGWFRGQMEDAIEKLLGDHINDVVDLYELPVNSKERDKLKRGTFEKAGEMSEYHVICYLDYMNVGNERTIRYDGRLYTHDELISTLHSIRIFSSKCLHPEKKGYIYPSPGEVGLWYRILESI